MSFLFLDSVVERTGSLFEKLDKKGVRPFGGREVWLAFCEHGLTEKMFFGFEVERNGRLFDKDVFSWSPTLQSTSLWIHLVKF